MKRFLKSSLSLILAITIIFSSVYVGLSEADFSGLFAVKAEAANQSDLIFTLNSDGSSYSVTYCEESASGELIIPDTYNGLPVVFIASSAFELCTKLTYIVIPDSVTSIGSWAFADCTSLNAVKIGDSVTSIGDCAFGNCTSLTSITIPDSVTSIGSSVFEDCTKLSSITISDSVTCIYSWAFENCTSLKTVYYSGSQEQWEKISIDSFGNDYLLSANIIFNNSGDSDFEAESHFTCSGKYGGTTSHKYAYSYKDSFFDNLATEYNHELATMSLCLALSTFQSENEKITFQNVENLLKDCDFDEIKPYNYSLKTTADNIACIISNKEIDGVTLIAVAVRSGGYDKEWASNLTLGYYGNHQGFDEASDIVLERISSYIKDKEITGKVKFWLTGYSRGAATATHTAAKLNSVCFEGVSFTKEQIYAYGFATPAGAVESSKPTDLNLYGNIFNIINFHDFVPRVAPEKWGFTRYGTTLFLPFSENSKSITENAEINVKKWFEKEGLEYKIDDFIPLYSEIPGITLPISNDSLGVFNKKLVEDISTSIGSRFVYTSKMQNSLRAIWTGDVDISIPFAIQKLLAVLRNEILLKSMYINTAVYSNSLLFEAHDAYGAYYLGWMQTIPANKALNYFNKGDIRHWLFNCPVDVYVYDTSGKLVAAIANDMPVEIEGSVFSYGVDENGQKYFYLPVDTEYKIKVQAREDCETTCTVNEFSGGSLEESRVVTYTEIPMKKYEMLSVDTEAYSETDITEGTENGSSAEYIIQREDGEVIEADVDVSGDDIENYVYKVTVEFDENKGLVYGGGEFTIGQFCQLIAENKPGYKFSRWVVNDKIVSTESIYRFAVKENITITAYYVPCKHIPSDWIIDQDANGNLIGTKHKECTDCGEILETKPIIEIIDSGKCGENITWTLDEEGTLKLEGSGAMTQFGYLESPFCMSNKIKKIILSEGITSIGSWTFNECSNLASVIIPDSVTSIGNSAFEYCTSLTSITIPDSVTSIGEYAFSFCESLKSIKIPDGVTSLSNNSFEYCTSLTSVSIPNTLKSVGNMVFYNCTNLASISLPDTVSYVGINAFKDTAYYNNQGNWENDLLYIGKHLIAAKETNSGVCSIKDGTKTIGGYAFKNCVNMTGVIIPDSVVFIGCAAFFCTTWEKVHYTLYYCGTENQWRTIHIGTENNAINHIIYNYSAKPATPKLSKVQNTASGVKVTWGAVEGADSYIVYRRTYNAKTKAWDGWTRLAAGVTSTTYVDKTAKSGTYYRYTVKAVNEAGNSGYNISGIKTYFLSTPTVSATNSNSGVTVKWTKAAGATGYYVYRKTGTGSWQRVATVKGAGTLSYTDKKAPAGVTYRYTVKAYYSSYVSAYNTNGFAVRRLTTPTLKSVTSAKSGVTFKWNKVTGATGYIVYRKTGNGGWQRIATIKGNTKVSYLDKTAKKGVTYKYTVKAYYGTSTSYYNTKGLTMKDKY